MTSFHFGGRCAGTIKWRHHALFYTTITWCTQRYRLTGTYIVGLLFCLCPFVPSFFCLLLPLPLVSLSVYHFRGSNLGWKWPVVYDRFLNCFLISQFFFSRRGHSFVLGEVNSMNTVTLPLPPRAPHLSPSTLTHCSFLQDYNSIRFLVRSYTLWHVPCFLTVDFASLSIAWH